MTNTGNVKAVYLIIILTAVIIVAVIGLFETTSESVFAGEENAAVVAVASEGVAPADAISEDEEAVDENRPGAIVINPPEEPVIEEEPTPLAAPEPEVTIMPEKPPLAVFATWALLNLILTIATGAIMAVLLVTYLRKRREDQKSLIFCLGAIAGTAVAVILFAATQNLSLPMFLADNFTITHFIIMAAVAAIAIVGMKKSEIAVAKE